MHEVGFLSPNREFDCEMIKLDWRISTWDLSAEEG